MGLIVIYGGGGLFKREPVLFLFFCFCFCFFVFFVLFFCFFLFFCLFFLTLVGNLNFIFHSCGGIRVSICNYRKIMDFAANKNTFFFQNFLRFALQNKSFSIFLKLVPQLNYISVAQSELLALNLA